LIAADLPLPIPSTGSQGMIALASSFEKTILSALDEDFECDMISIGGVPVRRGSDNDLFGRKHERDLEHNRILDSSSGDVSTMSDVLFDLRLIQPCPDCSNTQAVMLGAQVFHTTFDELSDKADSGSLSVIFCIFGEVAGVVSEPCEVTISSAEGTSLDVEFVRDDDDSDDVRTPRPTPKPVRPDPTPEPTPKPTAMPVTSAPTPKPFSMTWPPTDPPVDVETLPPTDQPVTTTPETLSPTASQTMPSDGVCTEAGQRQCCRAKCFGVPHHDGDELPGEINIDGKPIIMKRKNKKNKKNMKKMERMQARGETIAKKSDEASPPSEPLTKKERKHNMKKKRQAEKEKVFEGLRHRALGHTAQCLANDHDTMDAEAYCQCLHCNIDSCPKCPSEGGTPTPSPGDSLEPTTSPVAGGDPVDTMAPTTEEPDSTSSPTMTKSDTSSPTISHVPTSMTPGASSSPTSSPSNNSKSALPTVSPNVAPTTSSPTNAPSMTPSVAATTVVTGSPTSGDTVEATVAPTSMPPGAIYYDGFEQGTFPEGDDEWTTTGDALWELTSERAASGVYSIRSPILQNEELTKLSSNVTMTTNPNWAGGKLVYSVLAAVNMPFDNCFYYVDGEVMGNLADMTQFETQEIEVDPGRHTITWSYTFNPIPLPAFPPMPGNRIAAVIIDDVYLMPIDAIPVTPSPTVAVVPTALSTGSPTLTSTVTTVAPTSIPQGAIYYDGFEQGTFPEGDDEWTTTGDASWELTSERAASGVYSIRSPNHFNQDLKTLSSNVTINTNPNWAGGTLVYSVLAGVNMPYDNCLVYVDGIVEGGLSDMTEFETQGIEVGPGRHTITWTYTFNPVPLPGFPSIPGDRIGAVFIDDVYLRPIDAIPMTPSPTVSIVSTVSPSSSPTPSPALTTVAPTSIPPGAIYYGGFEKGTFPDGYGEWGTAGDASWELTTERAASGVYSIRSPDLGLDNITPFTSNVTFFTNPAWNDGTVVYSVLSGVAMPYDDLILYVDGVIRDNLSNMVEFETKQIQVGPGAHQIVWSYRFNPIKLAVMPPLPNSHIGAAFIDDVYFLPAGFTSAPSTGPPASLPVPGTAAPTIVVRPPTAPPTDQSPISVSPTPPLAPTTIAPTSTPPEALYYDGFERGTFPSDIEWSVAGDGLWELSSERATSGVFSIKSPMLIDADDTPTKNANVTLSTNPTWGDGTLYYSVLAGVNMPFDDLLLYVDGELRAEFSGMTEFQVEKIELGPGRHTITWSYKSNPNQLDNFPPLPSGRIGSAFIDDVYFVPGGALGLPAVPTGSPIASIGSTTTSPSVVAANTPSPNVASVDEFFDGFETGDLTALDWSLSGEQEWMVDETKPFEGIFSAHIRTDDISTPDGFAQLDLGVDLATAAFVQFYFYAPVSMPFESFNLQVDGQFLRGLSTEDETWAEGGAFLSSGLHTISWRLEKNPGGAPEAALENLKPPAYRLGEAWLDNVALLGATPSFLETWESGDFTANPWMLSGVGDWRITDSDAFEGANSATIKSDDIEANSGISELSIDIITEQGGTLTFRILPSVSGPFEEGNVMLDGIVVASYSSPMSDWIAQEIAIQPGKRKVTFQLNKNSGGIGAEQIGFIPSPAGRKGQMWLDRIQFLATVEP